MQQSRADRSAIIAPGGGYGPDGPLLMYSRLAVQRRGGRTESITWQLGDDADVAGRRRAVAAQVGSAIEQLTASGGAGPLIIGKSLGTLAAPLVADRGLAAVWLTPLLTDEPTVAALRRAEGPCLLVGGTGDQFWDGSVARSITSHVIEIDGADHGMFLPGPLSASAAVLGQVISAVEDFLDGAVWNDAVRPSVTA